MEEEEERLGEETMFLWDKYLEGLKPLCDIWWLHYNM